MPAPGTAPGTGSRASPWSSCGGLCHISVYLTSAGSILHMDFMLNIKLPGPNSAFLLLSSRRLIPGWQPESPSSHNPGEQPRSPAWVLLASLKQELWAGAHTVDLVTVCQATARPLCVCVLEINLSVFHAGNCGHCTQGSILHLDWPTKQHSKTLIGNNFCQVDLHNLQGSVQNENVRSFVQKAGQGWRGAEEGKCH